MRGTKVVTKVLAGAQDLLRGIGKQQQNRAGKVVTVDSIHLFIPVGTKEDLAQLDPVDAANLGVLVRPESVTYYQYRETISATGVKSTVASGWWHVLGNELAQGGTVQEAVTWITPQMFGAVADYNPNTKTGTDCTQAFKDAIAEAIKQGSVGVYVPAGRYLITDELNLGGVTFTSGEGERDFWRGNYKGVHLRGDGPYSTILVFRPPTNLTPCLSVRGGWGTHSPRCASMLAIEPYDFNYLSAASGTGILLQGCCFSAFSDINIGRFARGVHLWNKDKGANDVANTFRQGDFTEFNYFTRVRNFRSDVCWEFQVTLGNNSFRGNEMIQCQVENNVNNSGITLKAWDDGSREALKPSTSFYDYIANLYQCNLGFNITGSNTYTSYGYVLDGAQILGDKGDLSFEGNLTFKTTGQDWMQSNGNLTIYNGNFLTDVGATDTATRPVAFMFANAAWPQAPFDGVEPLLPVTTYPRQFDGNNVGNTGLDILNVRGSTGGVLFSLLQGSNTVGWCDSIRSLAGSRAAQRIIWQRTYAGDRINSLKSASVGLYNMTKGVVVTDTAIRGSEPGMNLGGTSFRYNTVFAAAFNIDTAIVPTQANTNNLASTSLPMRDIFSQNAVTVISDRRKKQQIQAIPDEVLDAFETVSFSMWKLNSAVEAKGEDARYHFGIVAQDIKEAFEAKGLDATDYGILIHDSWEAEDEVVETWEDEYEDIPAQEEVVVDGIVLVEAQEAQRVLLRAAGSEVIKNAVEAGDVWMVRMEECLALEAAVMRRKYERLEAKLA